MSAAVILRERFTEMSSHPERDHTPSFDCVLAAWGAHEGELRGYLLHRLGDAHAADDLLQEIFFKSMRLREGLTRNCQVHFDDSGSVCCHVPRDPPA